MKRRLGRQLPPCVSTLMHRAVPGIEPGTSRTRSGNHATRPNSQLEFILAVKIRLRLQLAASRCNRTSALFASHSRKVTCTARSTEQICSIYRDSCSQCPPRATARRAQSAERKALNLVVAGSSPTAAASRVACCIAIVNQRRRVACRPRNMRDCSATVASARRTGLQRP